MTDASPRTERVALSREYSVLLVEFAIALHKHAIYPEGHQALRPAADAVARRAARILAGRAQVSFGVAQHQLIIDGVATDPNHPVLRRLADTLHRQQLAALTLMRGIDAGEIGDALRALGSDPERGTALGAHPESLPSFPHLRMHALNFDRLTLLSDAATTDGQPTSGLRGTELWMGLARAAMAAEGETPLEAEAMEPAAVARAIDDRAGATAYDQVIVGHLLQIAEELRDASGVEAVELRQRTARLIAALRPETLRRLVTMGGDTAQRTSFVLDAAHGMAVESVLAIVQAAADASGQTISHGLSRMLAKLAAHAEHGDDYARPAADEALREQVGQLIANWELPDPNPEDYTRTLQRLADTVRRPSGTPVGDDIDRHDPLRVVQMALELNAGGARVLAAIDRIVRSGGVSELLALLGAAPDHARAAVHEVLARLVRPDAIRTLVAHEPLDVATLDTLLPSLPEASYEVLIDALTTSEDRLTRRHLLDRLANAHIDILPHVSARLEDDRWFVQRNMLWVMERLGRVPEDFAAGRWMAHRDPRVRLQAIRLQMARPAYHDAAVRTALADKDARIVATGLLALQAGCPASTVPLVRRLVEEHPDEGIRAQAARALGRSREPSALRTLLARTDGGRTWAGRPRLAPKSPVLLAALAALADGWARDKEASAVLALAAASGDPDIAAAARGGRS